MRQKKSYFNKSLFFKTLARFWPLWIGYLLLWLLLIMSIPDSLRYTDNPQSYVMFSLPYRVYGTAVVVAFISAVLSAMAVFSYLYNPKSAGMMGALPLRRKTVFLTHTLAGIACYWLANVLVFLLCAWIEASYGLLGFGLIYLIQLLALVSLLNLVFYGLAVLCAQLAGHLLALPAAYIMLSLAAVVVEQIVRNILTGLVFGLTGSSNVLYFLSPVAQLMRVEFSPVYDFDAGGTGVLTGSSFNGWPWVLVYAAVGVLFLLLAMELHRRRRLETAGDLVSIGFLKPVFKYCFATGCALVLTYIIQYWLFSGGFSVGTSTLLQILITLLLGAFLGYFAAEMMIKKSLRVFRDSWRGFAVLAAALIALTLICDFDVLGFEKRLPDSNEVTQVSVRCAGSRAKLSSPKGVEDVKELQSDIVSHKREHESAVAGNDGAYAVSIDYFGEDDTIIMSRRYNIAADSEDMENLEGLMNCREAIGNRKATDIPVTEENISYASVEYFEAGEQAWVSVKLTAEEAYELYTQCVEPDISDGTLGRVWLIPDEDYYQNVYAAGIHIELMERQPDGEYRKSYFDTTPTADAVRTSAWLSERGISLVPVGEVDREAGYAVKYG